MRISTEELKDLPVNRGATVVEIETRENGAGQIEYRHIFATDWKVVPAP